jgi:hypothetical protein
MTIQFKSLCALFAASALAACGGGGDGDAASATAPAPAPASAPITVVDALGNLNLSVVTSSYAANTVSSEGFDALNASRRAAGTGVLTQSTKLDVAATAHAAYLAALQQMTLTPAQITEQDSLHNEYADIVPAKYYAKTPQDRALKAGAIEGAGIASEGLTGAYSISNGQFIGDGAACVASLLNTVYHADTLLGYWEGVAVAQSTDGLGLPACVVDYTRSSTYGQVPAAGNAVIWPAAGATVSGMSGVKSEVPRPAPTLITTDTNGTPVLVNVRNADWVNAQANSKLAAKLTSFTLTAPDGSAVPEVILASLAFGAGGVQDQNDVQLEDGTVVLIPKAVLPAGTYSAHVVIAITSGVTLTKDWQFTTN